MNEIEILLVYGSGGHNEQMKRLSSEITELFSGNDKNILLISLCDEDVKHPVSDQVYFVPTITDKFSYLRLLFKMPLRIVQTLSILHRITKQHNIDYIITTGPGVGIVSALYFKTFKRKTVIHIETWSRFYSKSLTGRCMYYLADYFFVQNKELLNLYPKAIYKGRL